ncbi:glycosyltransferase family 4 protein [Haloarchaeobius sp. TZWSO28]|uniref:glycosyltransferase family 4 protein n=1 Tax=Haloarchaeobius sp. TZWSO28 TaxID=3446119 RepID=UPI003EBFFED2
MHVCMVLGHTYPPDVRIKKEAKALVGAGHEVTLLCRGRSDEPTRETVHGMQVVRLHTDTPLETAARYASAACNLVANIHPRWVRALTELVRETGADAIHVHDLPLVREGELVGRRTDVPVVADLHENYPEAIRQWRQPHTPSSLARDPLVAIRWAFKPTWRYRRIERRCVRDVERVVTVTEEAERHYQRDCAVLPHRTQVVSNTVDCDMFDAETATPKPGYEDEFVVGYVGTFGAHRGLDIAIAAMSHLLETVPNARLLLVGAGPDPYESGLREAAEAAGVADRVTFTGWVDFDEFPSYMATCDVCLVPHADTPHTNTTVPHKLFQYMALGKPVLVTDLPPLQRVVDDADSGVVVPAGDADAMGGALAALGTDERELARLGKNGRRAVEERYNWERDGGRLVDLYEQLGETTEST